MYRKHSFDFLIEYLLLPASLVAILAVGMATALDLRPLESIPTTQSSERKTIVDIATTLAQHEQVWEPQRTM